MYGATVEKVFKKFYVDGIFLFGQKVPTAVGWNSNLPIIWKGTD